MNPEQEVRRDGSPITRLAEAVGVHAGAQLAFGEPVDRGHMTVIPVASTAWGFGGGTGTAPITGGQRQEGAGGGGGARVRPVGYIVVRDDAVEFRPIWSPIAVILGAAALGVIGGALITQVTRRAGRLGRR